MQATKLFRDFFQSERAGGLILIACALLSMLMANSGVGESYLHFWHIDIAGHSLTHWINDLLMAVFFLLVGLEIEREIYVGELKEPGKAIFPIFGAFGGMVVPALIYVGFNASTGSIAGFGIPMATDIAFALGILSLAGRGVPLALKVFLTALAIMDDLGAIIIIAIFYSQELNTTYLFAAFGIFAFLILLNRLGFRRVFIYVIPGLVMWYCMLQSGVHATITGVLLAFAIPFRDGGTSSPSYKVQHALHMPVAFGILPLFALANTAIVLDAGILRDFIQPHTLGIFLGLVAGKPLGILLFTWLAVKMKWATLPEEVHWKQLTGAGMLAGIGFTMSIFISLLAFQDAHMIALSKMAILAASTVAAVLGLLWLRSSVTR